MCDDFEEPQWLKVIEKQKTFPLAHERGAGSLCQKCLQCPGLELHFWRKSCKICGCKQEDHLINENDVYQSEQVFGTRKVRDAKILFEGIPTLFDWLPKTTHPSLAEKFMEALPDNLRPIRGTYGSIFRRKQLMRQFPAYDLDPTSCAALSYDEIKAMGEYYAKVKKISAGTGTIHDFKELLSEGLFRAEPYKIVRNSNGDDALIPLQAETSALSKEISEIDNIHCKECGDLFQKEDVVVRTAHMQNVLWHPRCFLCKICHEFLTDLQYLHHSEDIYCGRDYAKAANKLRCFGCDEIIFENEYVKGNERVYHKRHFCCFVCDKNLAEKQFKFVKDLTLCTDCYEEKNKKVCESCKKAVPLFEDHILIKGKNYHKNEACFVCSACHSPLMGKNIFYKNGSLVCPNHV